MKTVFGALTKRALLFVSVAATVAAVSRAEPAVVLDDPYTRSADGITAYLGVVPASLVRGHPSTHPEGAMHGGTRGASYERHILVALFDSKSFKRITEAEVTATVEGLGHIGRVTKKLERMNIADAPTFGEFFSMPGSDIYSIRLEIVAAGYPKPVTIRFSYKT